MIVVDAHQDIAFNAVSFDRDYRLSVWSKRQAEVGTPVQTRNGSVMLGLPEALLGRVAVTFATLFTAPYSRITTQWAQATYRDPREAYQRAMLQADYYARLVDEHERVNLITSAAALDAVLATWDETTDIRQHQLGFVLLMENADPILEPKQFEEWYARGVRGVGPAWQATRYCGGTGQPGPLTTLGLELLDVLADFNVLLDVSHMAEAACMQALDRYTGPIIASHSNPRHFCPTDRHLTDTAIQRLAERDGVMGVVLYNAFLTENWDRRKRLPLSLVGDVIDYICQLTGSAAHVGLGSDFDGGFGMESVPQGLDTLADLLQIEGGLRARGYTSQDIAAIMGGNMLRKLREALPKD